MASNFQKFMATAEKHAVAGSSKLKATIAGHIYNIQIEEDLDNGSIVAKGDYIKPETYKAKDSTGFAGVVLDKAANGNWYVEVKTPGDALLLLQVPMLYEEYVGNGAVGLLNGLGLNKTLAGVGGMLVSHAMDWGGTNYQLVL